MCLRKSFPWKEWCVELLHDVYNLGLRAEPITRRAFRDAKLIVLRTKASLVAVPPRYRDKVHIDVGLGIAERVESKGVSRIPGEPLRLLYAGRILYWKGVHLAIRALANARTQGADATLTIVGGGAARCDLEKLACRLEIAAHIIWCGEVPRPELLKMYSSHHAFLFPSLRDAGGMVILEAWAHGLPVVCLALGGPGILVDENCGRVVPVANDEKGCVAALAAEILALAKSEDLRRALGYGAILRYREHLWSKVVAALYTEIDHQLH
jgi:glycosyltransferase involved in cell wall biosynthesis